MILRPYQREAVDAVYHHLRTRDDNPCVVLPTAAGKTPVMATICRDAVHQWDGRVAVVSHVKELIEQTVDKIKAIAPDLPVGVCSAGLRRKDLDYAVTVAGIQSIWKRAADLGRVDLLLIDECFPAGTNVATPIGEIPIERIVPGQLVCNATGTGEVLATSARCAGKLVRLEFDDDSCLECTPEHPIFTRSGWRKAAELEPGEVAFGVEDMRTLRKLVQAVEEDPGERQSGCHAGSDVGEAEILLDLLLQEARERDVPAVHQGEGRQVNSGDGPPTEGARRQREAVAAVSGEAPVDPRSWVADRVRRANEDSTRERLADPLQARSREPGGDDCGRNRRQMPSITFTPGKGPEEDRVPRGKRLVRVSHHQREGGVVVYNLHVGGHPSYFAEGTLVHNCHLIPIDDDGMYRSFIADARIVNPNLRVVGLTATPYRMKSGTICAPDAILNHVCYEIGVRELIVQGYLCPLRTKAGTQRPDFDGLHVRAGEFVQGEVETLMDGEGLVDAACREILHEAADRRSILVFAAGVEHGRHVVGSLAALGVECGFVTADTPAAERIEIVRRFRDRELRCLANVSVFTTGFDAPNVDCVVLLRPTMSPGLFYQMCLDMETEVLTPDGWRRCHEVAVGDPVAAFDVESEEIVYATAVDKVHRAMRPGESMYGISSPHLDIRVTDQHTMVVRGRAKSCLRWQMQTAEEASRRRETFTVPVAGKGRCHDVDADLSDSEVAFVGWFLTDGYLNPHNNAVVIAQSASKFADEVRGVIRSCGMGFREYRIPRTGKQAGYADGITFVIPRGQGKQENAGLPGWSRLAPWLDKDIPAIFGSLSRRQFAILLKAMDGGNGSNRKAPGKTMSISFGCRRRMADRIQKLAIERGYRCNVSEIANAPTAWNPKPQPQWVAHIREQSVAGIGGLRSETEVNALGAKRNRLAQVEFDRNEWVWCLTTGPGTLVTRRRGKVAILGNCGRGFRLHPDKHDCLVLDFGGNVLRHGPVDLLSVEDRKKAKPGAAAAKECPQCHELIATGYQVCPRCGHAFPPRERERHEAQATAEGILSGQVTRETERVHETSYHFHTKRDNPDAPPTMRVQYRVGFQRFRREWICFEHEGYARRKAEQWWQARSSEPVPKTVEEAVDLANMGALCETLAVTIEKRAGEKFERVVSHELGPRPPRVESEEGLPEPKPKTSVEILEEEFGLPF